MDIMLKGQPLFVAMQAPYLDWLQSHRSMCAMRWQGPQPCSRYQVPAFEVVTITENWKLEIQLCGPVFSPACTRPFISLQHPVGGSRKEKGGENDSEGNRRMVSLSRLLKLW